MSLSVINPIRGSALNPATAFPNTVASDYEFNAADQKSANPPNRVRLTVVDAWTRDGERNTEIHEEIELKCYYENQYKITIPREFFERHRLATGDYLRYDVSAVSPSGSEEWYEPYPTKQMELGNAPFEIPPSSGPGNSPSVNSRESDLEGLSAVDFEYTAVNRRDGDFADYLRTVEKFAESAKKIVDFHVRLVEQCDEKQFNNVQKEHDYSRVLLGGVTDEGERHDHALARVYTDIFGLQFESLEDAVSKSRREMTVDTKVQYLTKQLAES